MQVNVNVCTSNLLKIAHCISYIFIRLKNESDNNKFSKYTSRNKRKLDQFGRVYNYIDYK